MAAHSQRTEYADKTLALNAMIDRRLKIKISNLDAESSIYKRELAREEKVLRQELSSSRRMSLQSTQRQGLKNSRRASGPIRCKTETSSSEDISDGLAASSTPRLAVPSNKTLRRRSLPDIEKLTLPALPSDNSLTAAKPRDNANVRFRSGRRCSENVGNLSQLQTPCLSPRHSISSLVSSLSNSTNRLQTLKDSEETFDRVRQFLQKLDASKLRSDSEQTEDSLDNEAGEVVENIDG
eukprot:Seg2540.3 transcript_id=Seg2540.3/GoldUCD/mRNA.D3Y31 product="hypothetical protein" protein_id=Seg2540.3/GoldUCD/D3Y31